MQNINVLDSSIYNRISAGEVVERPASVIKELVENSLDAKATNITIEIQDGGTKLIKITDNGSGILYNDLKKAFLPHATSKIKNVEDLDSISTLGFRGEALPSIASVSKVELFSKTKDSDIGGKIIVNGGAFEDPVEYGCVDGTTIIVKDLFYNTPARLKFLKSNKQEESQITNIVNRLILANPDISFKYIVDGKIVYNANIKGLKEKIYTIYGKSFLENIIEVNFSQGPYKINGYISLPSFCKSNKTYQTLIVNGRYVSNNLISVAVSNAYENFLMKGKFPIFVLNFNLDFEDIDVNVHPSKMEVKFKDTKTIYNLFYSLILQTLSDNNAPVNYQVTGDVLNEDYDNKTEFKQDENLPKVSGGFSFKDLQNFSEEISNINISTPKYIERENVSVLKSSINEIENNFNNSEENFTNNNNKNINMNENLFSPIKKENLFQEKLLNDIHFEVIGTLFNTYILLEVNEDFILIDQHAGHERLLYDNLMKDFEEKKLISQPLLVPYVFNVNELEEELIENSFDVFNKFGFEIENYGRLNYRINAVPNVLSNIDLKAFIDEILKDLTKISNNNELIKNHFAKIACKSAVKGGQKLSRNEISILINNIFNSKTTLLCPHGRPICVKMTKYEVEKMFKRIV